MDKKIFSPTAEQKAAANPARSVWVMANAGSGKTQVLVDRVVRLLLTGVAPSAILCLTYTKAAAAEMAARLFALLSDWIRWDDVELAATLTRLGLERVSATDLARARQLFALAIETPGGLKIQTIHAFCEKLLQLFPAESGLAPGFKVLDDTQRKDLLQRAYQSALNEAADAEADALSLLDDGSIASGERFADLARAFFDGKAEFRAALDETLPLSELDAALRQALGTENTTELEAALQPADRHAFQNHARALADVTPFHKVDISRLIAAVAESGEPTQLYEALMGLLFTGGGTPRAGSRLFYADTHKINPEAVAYFREEFTRLTALMENHALALKVDATIALISLLRRVWQNFTSLKAQAAAYDFDDLIQRTAALLTSSRAAQWVLYKLDGGLSHILVDEAQDTSPAQWDIVKALAGEFFAGAGVPGRGGRSVFAVGDIKQSIYSFQGADVTAFAAAREHFKTLLVPHGTLSEIDLKISYRTLPAILEMVDVVFHREAPAAAGLASDGTERDHVSHRKTKEKAKGSFELWPLFRQVEEEERDNWQAPVDRPPENSPRLRMAEHVAKTVAGWIGKRKHPSQARAIAAGDILILLQRRGALFEALISNLRQQGVAVAGADRLTLQDNIAVQDVLALMQFCLLPEDDLSLACVLKSPLMDPPLNDDDLIALAPNRKASLWQALQENPAYAAACKTLAGDLAAARSEGPHGFILRVLNRARPFMARRLGDEAVDATNMLVDAALDFERDSGPSLAAFLHAFQARSEDVKRELSQSEGQLRVMTVHGAKGLEADIVILPDAADLPRGSGGNSIFAVTGKGNLPLSLPFFDSPTDIKPGALKQWKDEGKTASLHERKRLLYVAMTRARDALYVGGVEGRNQVSEHSWYSLIEAAFKLEAGQGKLRTIAGVHPEGDIRRYGDDPVPWLQAEKPNVKTETPLPLWASAPVLPDTIERHRAASHLAARRGTVIDAVAARRGLAIHRFLEKARSGDADGNERLARRLQLPQQVTEKLLGLMAEPAHAAWFGPEALIEAAIAGNIAGLPPIQGRVDRLSLGDALITVLDFKSGRRTPETLAEYHGQMAGYVELLRLAYPGRRVRAALLWTQDGWLEPLDDAILADAITQMRLAYVAGVT